MSDSLYGSFTDRFPAAMHGLIRRRRVRFAGRPSVIPISPVSGQESPKAADDCIVTRPLYAHALGQRTAQSRRVEMAVAPSSPEPSDHVSMTDSAEGGPASSQPLHLIIRVPNPSRADR